ncbi:CD109 antigen-like isoform X2 [Chironomus tepperi]|uniref:CD109 antigen-like isoform X2 n=1 Tax=Chironomus tepperi TaxID=113505 RepID=UPI00391F20CD
MDREGRYDSDDDDVPSSSTYDSSNGFFTIVAGNIFPSNGKFRVGVYSFGYEKKEEIEISISSKDTDYEKKERVMLFGTRVQNVDFEIKNAPEGDYNLNVTSLSGEHFDETRSLHMNHKKYAVFVQTDKRVYKPSDNIKFRVMVLDAETRPYNFESIDIYITDGGDNRIKQYDEVEKNFNKGVYQNELQLSDMPVMGVWKIHVKVNGDQDIVKSFDVEEYVLPKFELSIDTIPNIPFTDGSIKATVNAKYTFGKIAKGKATVTADVEYPYRGYRNKISESGQKISKSVDVDGKKFVEFDFKEDLKIRDNKSEHTVNLHATFKDDLSGKEATATAKVKIHSNSIKMELKKSAEKFKLGLPFEVTAILSTHDKSTPVVDASNPVKFTVTSYYDILRKVKSGIREYICGRYVNPGDNYECWEENSREQEYKKNIENGIAKIDIDVPKDTTCFTIKAKYLSVEQEIHRIQKVDSMCHQYLQARLVTEKPLLSEKIKIKVQTTTKIKELIHQVLSGGKILESKHEKFSAATSEHMLTIIPTVFMLPKATVVIYYIAENGEIVSDKIDVEFGNQLLNHINLKLSTEQAKPGEDLVINVNSQPNSYVGLLGVDQSVLLLKKGNDIEQQTVFDELRGFGEVQKYNYSYYHSNVTISDFHEMILMTNCRVPQERRVHAYECEARFSMASRCHDDDGVRMMAMSTRAAPKMMMMRNDMMMDSEPMVEMAFGAAPVRKPVEIRKKFPETWLFDNLEFDSSETKSLTKKVPDTITSWIITGFSLDPIRGLAITDTASKLRVFQPFIVDTNLPYSIKRGEVVSIPIIIFNYLDSDETTTVTIYNADAEFEFINPDDDDISIKKQKLESETQRTQEIVLKSDEGATVSFMIRPLKVGHITIKVVAESQMAGDGVEKKLKVEPEGVTQYMNEAVLIDLRSEKEFKKTIDILVPKEAVPDSTRVEVSAIGDILGPSIDNLDKLIQLPYGCGEQNMLNFVPNIVVLDYLTNLNKLNPQIESKAKKYMEVGYQKELSYKHDDGSYSAFGKHDRSGSTWLTAFVAKSFNQASKYIKIDHNVILEALNFLKNVQAKDGSFPEVGTIFHRDMQGGSSKGIGLTAYTLITFLENKSLAKKFENVIENAQNFIFDNLDTLDDNYTLAIVNYALQLSKNVKKDALLDKLNTKSVNKDGMKHWTKDIEKPKSDENSWYHKPSSVNVEMSAYALQAFLEADKTNDAVLIMKWLVTQRNENGGFQSTQDTVVGLQALSKLAMKVHTADSNLQITVKPKDSEPAIINVNEANSLVLQKHELSSDARHFEVSATGKGFSILQISYRYNLDISGQSPRFILNPVVKSTSNKGFLHLSVGAKFVPDATTITSNMAVMEVTLPSGFTFDNDHMSELLATEKVKKVETKDGDTVIMVYFDDIGATEIIPEFKAYRSHAVAKQKPAPIIIYDYYDNTRSARTFYNPPEILISDIVAA